MEGLFREKAPWQKKIDRRCFYIETLLIKFTGFADHAIVDDSIFLALVKCNHCHVFPDRKDLDKSLCLAVLRDQTDLVCDRLTGMSEMYRSAMKLDFSFFVWVCSKNRTDNFCSARTNQTIQSENFSFMKIDQSGSGR